MEMVDHGTGFRVKMSRDLEVKVKGGLGVDKGEIWEGLFGG
jgi:hypothetical protein